MEHLLAKLSIFLILAFACDGRTMGGENLTITVIHMNDVHAHFDEVNSNVGELHVSVQN